VHIQLPPFSLALLCVVPRSTTTASLDVYAMHLRSSQFSKQAHVTNTAPVSVRCTVCLAP
jgi:hypothetical protein